MKGMAAITNTTTFALLDLANSSTLEQDNMTFGSTIASVNYNTPFNDIPDLRPEKETTSYKLYLDYKLYYFIIDVILILPTILGNSLIIISLIRFKNLRKTKTFILIGNLGISDLLVGLVFFPMDLVIIHKPALWQDQVMCVCYISIIFTFLTASVLNLFLLSLERFHAITRPLQHNSMFTTKRIYYTACIIWIFVILTGFTPLYLFSSGHLNFINFESCTDIFLFDSPYILVMNCIAIIALVITFGLFVVVIRIALR